MRQPRWWLPIVAGAVLSSAIGGLTGAGSSFFSLEKSVAVALAELQVKDEQHDAAIKELRARPMPGLDAYVKREEMHRAMDQAVGRIDRMEHRIDKRLDQVLDALAK